MYHEKNPACINALINYVFMFFDTEIKYKCKSSFRKKLNKKFYEKPSY